MDDIKYSFQKFNRDFLKLSEYFSPTSNQQENPIEILRTSKKDKIIHKESLESHNIIKKEEEVFYGANEEEEGQNDQEQGASSNAMVFESGINKKDELKLNKFNNLMTDLRITSEGKIEEINSLTTSHIHGKFFDPMYEERRKNLPLERKQVSVNVWGILRDAIGKDLSKFAMPGNLIFNIVYFNEPLSMLQRICENFQYAAVLNRAAKEPNPYMRLSLVAAFLVGGYATSIYRTLKFFNPLLSETFEFVDNELNCRYYSEQVSHHPPITAYYAEGDGYTLYSNTESKSSLRITGYFEFEPLALTYVKFSNFNEVITYTKPKSIVRNLIMGKMYIDTVGCATVSNRNGDACNLEFIEKSGNNVGIFKGEVKDENGDLKMKIEGSWCSHMDVINVETGEKQRIWERFIVPGKEEDRYFFTEYAANLNNLTEEMKKSLPPSDTRFRPDQRYLEMQDIDMAGKEKNRLEEKQRATRKYRETNKIKYKPIYFQETYGDLGGDPIFIYKGGYFEDRQRKDFSKFQDIYS